MGNKKEKGEKGLIIAIGCLERMEIELSVIAIKNTEIHINHTDISVCITIYILVLNMSQLLRGTYLH